VFVVGFLLLGGFTCWLNDRKTVMIIVDVVDS